MVDLGRYRLASLSGHKVPPGNWPSRALASLEAALAALGLCSLAALQITAITGRKLQHHTKLYTGGCFGVTPGLQMWKGRQRIFHSCESVRAEFEVCWPWVEYWLCDLGKTPAQSLTSLLHSHWNTERCCHTGELRPEWADLRRLGHRKFSQKPPSFINLSNCSSTFP